jgi:hypothetical protein
MRALDEKAKREAADVLALMPIKKRY